MTGTEPQLFTRSILKEDEAPESVSNNFLLPVFRVFVVNLPIYANFGLTSSSNMRDCSRTSSDAMRAMTVVSPAAA
jgi:hypothetical protein